MKLLAGTITLAFTLSQLPDIAYAALSYEQAIDILESSTAVPILEPCRLLLEETEVPDGFVYSWNCAFEVVVGSNIGDIMLPIEGLDIPYDSLDDNGRPVFSGHHTIFAIGMKIENGSTGRHVTFPLDVSPTIQVVQQSGRNRKLAVTKGDKKILAVRVVGADTEPTASASDISDSIFGTHGDPVNVASQYAACSKNRLAVSPAPQPATGTLNVTDGVVELPLAYNLVGGSRYSIVNAALSQLGANGFYRSAFDNLMLCLPPGTSGTWGAYSYVDHWLTVYNDEYCGSVSTQMHEIGHNMGLEHSGEAGVEYGDRSGAMGPSYPNNDAPKLCFNGPKTWQLGWYDDRHTTVEPLSECWNGDIIGLVDYPDSVDENVVVKINTSTETDFYVNFNRRLGFNAHTQEGGDQVMITSQGGEGQYPSESALLAKLDSYQSYSIDDFDNSGESVTITHQGFVLRNTYYVAQVAITLGDCTQTSQQLPAPTPLPTPAPTPLPTPAPTPSPTPAPTTPAPTPQPTPAPTPAPTPQPTPAPTTPAPTPQLTPAPTPQPIAPAMPQSTAPTVVQIRTGIDVPGWIGDDEEAQSRLLQANRVMFNRIITQGSGRMLMKEQHKNGRGRLLEVVLDQDSVEIIDLIPSPDYSSTTVVTQFNVVVTNENPQEIQETLTEESQAGAVNGTLTEIYNNELFPEFPTLAISPPSQPYPPAPIPSHAGAYGDPHFRTWAAEMYDFHGICDLVLLQNDGFQNGLGMDIHIRTKKMKRWSYISNAVLRIGEDTFEVIGAANGNNMQHWINDGAVFGSEEQLSESSMLFQTISGYPLLYKKLNSKRHEFTVQIGNDENIVIETWKSFVRVDIQGATYENFVHSLGLMGTFKEGLHVARDGRTILNDVNEFGEEWQVLLTEQTSLFHSLEGPQFPEKCVIPSAVDMRRHLRGSTISVEEAAIACSNVVEIDRDYCIFDVLATGDLDIVGAY